MQESKKHSGRFGRRAGRLAALLSTSLVAVGLVAASAGAATYSVTAGSQSGGSVPNGSYIQLFTGSPSSPSYLTNYASTNSDKHYTYLGRGTDTGLITGQWQAPDEILSSVNWDPDGSHSQPFTVFTTNGDPVNQKATGWGAFPKPALTFTSGTLTSGNVSGWTVVYGTGANEAPAALYNTGADVAGDDNDGDTLTGTRTGASAYTLTWTSKIHGYYSGDPFDGAYSTWHLVGAV